MPINLSRYFFPKRSLPGKHVAGALSMIAGIATLAAMDATAKWLVLDGIHALQLLATRSVLIVVTLVVIFGCRKNLKELKPTRPAIQAIRGISGIVAPLSFFMALQHLPLTDAVVVFFTSVFAVTILSALLLGEAVGKHRWTAVITGYTGVVIAMTPDGSGSALGYALTILSSLAYAGLFVSGRWLSKTETVSSLVLSYNLGVGLIACLLLPAFWQSMTADQWGFVVLMSALAVTGHYALTYAFSLAEASFVAPFEYTAIIWALLFDFFIWQSLPAPLTGLGALIIIASGVYVMHRENLKKRDSDSGSQQ